MIAGRQHETDVTTGADMPNFAQAPTVLSDAEFARFTEMLASGLLAPVFEHQTAVQGNRALSFDNAVRMVPPKF